VRTDLARRALARPGALTPTLAPRVARSLARFAGARYFSKPLNNWDTSKVTDMSLMWVLPSPAVRSPAPTRSRSRSRSLRASLARSLARFYGANAFNQDLSGWVVTNVNRCWRFCARSSPILSFPESCGDPGC